MPEYISQPLPETTSRPGMSVQPANLTTPAVTYPNTGVPIITTDTLQRTDVQPQGGYDLNNVPASTAPGNTGTNESRYQTLPNPSNMNTLPDAQQPPVILPEQP
jgi:hypothetical protein